MTKEQSNYFKNNWISFSTLVVVVGFVIQQSQWQQKIDSHVKQFDDHVESRTMHVPFEEKIKTFVPRVELDSRLQSIEKALNKIDLKLDKFYK